MRFCEASAKDNFNVDEIFLKLVDDILKKVKYLGDSFCPHKWSMLKYSVSDCICQEDMEGKCALSREADNCLQVMFSFL